MKTKICKSCGAEKAISDYYVRKDGWVFSRCKQCYLSSDKRRGDFADHQHKEHARKQKAAWRSKRPEYDRAQKANSRASKMGVDGVLTPAQVRAVWDRWNGGCWICGQTANQLDHFRPLNKRAGGTNTPDNVRPICNSCNHKRDHGWHGEEVAIKEADMLRAIQEMLRGSGTASAGLPGYAAGGNGERK